MSVLILFESPGSEETTKTETAAPGANIILTSRYNLDLPYSNGIRSVSLHTVTARIIKIHRGEVELELTTKRDSFIEKDGKRLIVTEKIV